MIDQIRVGVSEKVSMHMMQCYRGALFYDRSQATLPASKTAVPAMLPRDCGRHVQSLQQNDMLSAVSLLNTIVSMLLNF